MKIKTIFLQFCITVGLFSFAAIVIIEAPPRISRHFSNSNPIKCKNISILGTVFLYGSCPNNTYLTQPGPDYPNMVTTTSCTDSLGFRVNCKHGQKVFDRSKYQTYLIGDSFIQARELDYEQSVYGLINKSKSSPYKNAYGFGFSSWNTRQYLQAIKAINRERSNYDIYLFANDITPKYRRSVYGEINTASSDLNNNESSIFENAKKILMKSITLQKVAQIKKKINSSRERNEYWINFKDASSNQCPSLSDQTRIDSFSPVARDYIMYFYASDCWDSAQKEAYNLVKEDLNQILSYGDVINSQVRIILFPAGFSFFDENTPGRLHESYDIPSDTSLSLLGLRRKLAEDFGENLVDVEDDLHREIKKIKQMCKVDCANTFYFGYDGHFTAKGHEFLFKTLYSH